MPSETPDPLALTGTPLRKRRWYQFSLRTLLVLTTLAGFGLAYVAYERRLADHQQQIKMEMQKYGIVLSGFPRRPKWLRLILGDDSAGSSALVMVRNWDTSTSPKSAAEVISELGQFPRISILKVEDSTLGDDWLVHVGQLPQIKWLQLSRTQVTDRGLRQLDSLENLTFLDLQSTKITDEGLALVAHHQNLKTLYLNGTKVTDVGLHELRSLKNLKLVDLSGTQVTDAGLEELSELSALEEVGLQGTLVTDAGIQKLQIALPNAKIYKQGLPAGLARD